MTDNSVFVNRRPTFDLPERDLRIAAVNGHWACVHLMNLRVRDDDTGLDEPFGFEWRAARKRVTAILDDEKGFFWYVREVARHYDTPLSFRDPVFSWSLTDQHFQQALCEILSFQKSRDVFARMARTTHAITSHKMQLRFRISNYRDERAWRVLWLFHDYLREAYRRLLCSRLFNFAPNTLYGNRMPEQVVVALCRAGLKEHLAFQRFHSVPHISNGEPGRLLTRMWGHPVFSFYHDQWRRVSQLTPSDASTFWDARHPRHRRARPAEIASLLHVCGEVCRESSILLSQPWELDEDERAGFEATADIGLILAESMQRAGGLVLLEG